VCLNMDAAIFCERSVHLFPTKPSSHLNIQFGIFFFIVTKLLRFKSKCSPTFLGVDVKILF